MKDKTHVLAEGKELKFCDADRFDLAAGFGTDPLFN